MIGACQALVSTLYYLGEFETARQYATRGVQIWRSGGVQYNAEDLDAPAVVCLCYEALCRWHLGEVAFCHQAMEEAISLAKELNETNSLAVALHFSAFLARYERNPAEVERLAVAIQLSYQLLRILRFGASLWRGFARVGVVALGDTDQGIASIEGGIRDYRQPARFSRHAGVGSYNVGLRRYTLQNSYVRGSAAIAEAEAVAQRTEERESFVELHLLRGVSLVTIGADELQMETLHFAKP